MALSVTFGPGVRPLRVGPPSWTPCGESLLPSLKPGVRLLRNEVPGPGNLLGFDEFVGHEIEMTAAVPGARTALGVVVAGPRLPPGTECAIFSDVLTDAYFTLPSSHERAAQIRARLERMTPKEPETQSAEPREEGPSRRAALAAVVLIALLALGGLWTVNLLREESQREDCLLQHRLNCGETIPAPSRGQP